jgi:hypothetical protein
MSPLDGGSSGIVALVGDIRSSEPASNMHDLHDGVGALAADEENGVPPNGRPRDHLSEHVRDRQARRYGKRALLASSSPFQAHQVGGNQSSRRLASLCTTVVGTITPRPSCGSMPARRGCVRCPSTFQHCSKVSAAPSNPVNDETAGLRRQSRPAGIPGSNRLLRPAHFTSLHAGRQREHTSKPKSGR